MTHRTGRRARCLAVLVLGATCGLARGQEPRLVPELTEWERTSTYTDVVGAIETLAARSSRLHATTFGYSLEGRSLPLVVAGADAATPEAVRASGKTRVYLQGNIHGGEVCGKEALLLLLRDLADGCEESLAWLDRLVLLVAPIYNADGNERVALTNRPRQHGPIGGMGQRRNAQDLDLNRDHMKLETPEARSLLSLVREYDPHLFVDLHTTNGTVHAYHLTYAPPLHPGTDVSISSILREDWLPDFTRRMRAEGWGTWYYGNLPFPGSDAERAWYTFDHRPRFNNNYFGLRNRPAILSEAYSYSPFEERVRSTHDFVKLILDRASRDAEQLRELTAAADEASVVDLELPLRARMVSSGPAEVLLGEVDRQRHPYTGDVILRRRDRALPETLEQFGTFEGTDLERAPRAYVLGGESSVTATVVDLLRAHGIEVGPATGELVGASTERFEIASSTTAEREFEGHRLRDVVGAWQAGAAPPGADDLVARVDQPLGRLLFYLLEPRSDDGLVTWNVFDEEIEAGSYPVRRIPAP